MSKREGEERGTPTEQELAPKRQKTSLLGGLFAHSGGKATAITATEPLRAASFVELLASRSPAPPQPQSPSPAVAWDEALHSTPSHSLAPRARREHRGAKALLDDLSLHTAVTLASRATAAFEWAHLPTTDDEAAALEGSGLAALPRTARPQARLLHALQRFELRLSPGCSSGVDVAFRSLLARAGTPAVPCFYVLGTTFAALVHSPSRAVVHPASMLRAILSSSPSPALETVSTKPSVEEVTTAKTTPLEAEGVIEELEELEKSVGGLMAVRRPGEPTAAEAHAAATADSFGPPAVIDGTEAVQRFVAALAAVPNILNNAVVISPGAFVGGTLRRAAVNVTTAIRGNDSLEPISLLRITDAVLTQHQLLSLLDLAAQHHGSFTAELSDVIAQTAFLSTSSTPGSFVCRADWSPPQGYRCFVTTKELSL